MAPAELVPDGCAGRVLLVDADDLLPTLPDGAFQLIYVDPPFNTGKTQARGALKYADAFDDYLGFLGPKLEHLRRLLRADGTLYVHLDQREAHYVKVALDTIFGRDAFLNEVIWAYDYGGRRADRWPQKHDTLLVYVKTPGGHFFDRDQIDRVPYLAPGLVTPAKRERGKLPTDVWWNTIVPTNSREKTGYPTQKPEAILKRVIQASSAPGEVVFDCFAGSGTTGVVARSLGRRFLLADSNPEAIEVIRARLGPTDVAYP